MKPTLPEVSGLEQIDFVLPLCVTNPGDFPAIWSNATSNSLIS